MDDGVYQDALTAAAEHGMSVSAWITRRTRLETMRRALTRHQRWCADEGLTGPDYEQQSAHVAADVGQQCWIASARYPEPGCRPARPVASVQRLP